MTPPRIGLARRDTVRLIPSGRLKPPALAPLADGAEALSDLAALEGVTSARLRAERSGQPGLDPRELVFGAPNNSFVNAAFTHVRPGGNRFNDAARGAWYCGFDAATALDEVAYHLTRELALIGRFENATDYAELYADFIGAFHDLRDPAWADHACLGEDPAKSYPAGQALARALRDAGGLGLVYPSVRHRGGTCLVAFHPALVQNVRQGGLWRLTWAGGPVPAVTRPSA